MLGDEVAVRLHADLYLLRLAKFAFVPELVSAGFEGVGKVQVQQFVEVLLAQDEIA